MAAAAVCLGFWIGRSSLSFSSLIDLCIAAGAATAFGNVVNDMRDVVTDRISHPDRPLVHGAITMRAAGLFALLLALLSGGFASMVSTTHLVATLIPLALLLLYARFLKSTPLSGNIMVSLLVAYPLLYGGLLAPAFHRLLVPASAAFLVNGLREIVKDLQDEPGDRAAGLVTTAVLPQSAINAIVMGASILFLALLPAPIILHQFGLPYALVCLFGIAPMHGFWMARWAMRGRRHSLPLLSVLLKWEMLLGLLAMAGDQLISATS
jgi:geranylgeranylglycerol-phosphate geranylgeranyltransferase